MKAHKQIQTFVSILLVIIFLGYYAGATLFNHTHTYDWGKVTHSHPYLPSAGHSHTAASLHTIESLTQLDFVVTSVAVMLVFVVATQLVCKVKKENHVNVYWNHSNLRAPPLSL